MTSVIRAERGGSRTRSYCGSCSIKSLRSSGMGYDNVWVTEHHFVEDDYNPSVMTALAAIAVRTERIRIGSFVMLMPFQNPLRIAEDGACVDNWSNGRLELGVGQGYRIDEFSGFCMSRPERTARMAEGIALVDRLWTEENVTFEGKIQPGQERHHQSKAGAEAAAAYLDRGAGRQRQYGERRSAATT